MSRNWEDWRKEYMATPIPEELASVTSHAIRASRRAERLKRSVWWWVSSGLAAALLVFVLLSPSGVLGSRKDTSHANNAAEQTNEESSDIEVSEGESKDAAGYGYAPNRAMPGWEALQNALPPKAMELLAAGEFTVLTDNAAVLSVAFAKDGVPQVSPAIYTVDKAAGKTLALKDLFVPGATYREAILESVLGQGLLEGGKDSLAADANLEFTITPEGKLAIVFFSPGDGQGAHYAINTQAIRSILREDAPIR